MKKDDEKEEMEGEKGGIARCLSVVVGAVTVTMKLVLLVPIY